MQNVHYKFFKDDDDIITSSVFNEIKFRRSAVFHTLLARSMLCALRYF